MKLRRLLMASGLVVTFVLGTGAVASAHVTPDPDTAVKGAGDQVFTFRVPNEMPDANTNSLTLQLPQDHPIAAVDVLETPGWTSTIKTTHLATPIKTDDGSFSDVVSEITWTGGSITPGRYGEFKILAMGLPTNTDTLTFKAVQSYDNGKTVNWVDTGKNAQDPAPVVTLTNAAASDSQSKASAAKTVTVTKSSKSSNTPAIVAIVIGVIGLLVAAAAIVLARRKNPAASGS